MPDTAAHGSQSSPEAYALFVHGTGFLRDGHPGAAAVLLERAARLAPGKSSVREALAQAYFALGRPDRAAELFAAILTDVPSNDYAQFGLGCALLALGRWREARGCLRLAVAMNPANADYAARLAAADRALA